MPTTLENADLEIIEAAALQLPLAEQALLVERLMSRLDADPEIERAWIAEAQRRDEAAEKDPALWLSGPEALASLRAKFQ